MSISLDEIADFEAFAPYLVYKDPERLLYHFVNDYGASIVNHPFSYGIELAVLKWADGGFLLTYDTGITNDVIGWLESVDEVEQLLTQIQTLEA